MGILTLKCWHFEASKDIMTKFKSQGLVFKIIASFLFEKHKYANYFGNFTYLDESIQICSDFF